jgi:membrane-associated phospholipid phosphatase
VLSSLNAFVLGRVSHQLNTFPSGHVAVAAAAAASVATISAPAGVLLGLAVSAICVGAAAGRYHYVVDVVLGLAVAVIAFLTAKGV